MSPSRWNRKVADGAGNDDIQQRPLLVADRISGGRVAERAKGCATARFKGCLPHGGSLANGGAARVGTRREGHNNGNRLN